MNDLSNTHTTSSTAQVGRRQNERNVAKEIIASGYPNQVALHNSTAATAPAIAFHTTPAGRNSQEFACSAVSTWNVE